MQGNNKALVLSLVSVAASIGLGAQCPQSNGFSDVRAPLARTGVDPDARGQVWSTLSGIVAQMQVEASGLAPNTSYEVAVDGTPKAALVTNASGAGKVVLRSGDSASDLDFDPRGREVELRHGGDDVLVTSLDNGSGSTAAAEEFVLLDPAPGVAGRASAKHRTRDGREKFSVEVEHVVPGSYALFVNGTQRGTIVAAFDPARGEVRGEIEFDSHVDNGPHDELLLDFPVADAQIDLLFDGAIAFQGVLRAGVPSVNVCEPSEILRRLTGSPGEAKARFRVRDDCDRDFEVEIEDVPAGPYTLRVGGVVRGTIVAAFDAARGRVRGEIEFDTDADEADELPLTFDPRGQSIEVLAGAQVAFSIASLEAGPVSAPIPCSPVDVEIEQGLFPGSTQPAASGHTRLRLRDDCRADLNVEIEDVVAGTYDIVVGGVVRGSVTAVFVPARGQVWGEVEFGDDSPGAPPLDFDPREQPIDIVQNGVTVLSTTFGGAGGGNPNASCVDDRTEVSLLNQGVDANARAEARLRVRDDCRESFTVEIEDVAPGSYQLLVNGVVEGTITVGALGQGELELDTADPPKPVLDFDPRGQEIAIAQGGTVLFARIFPQ